MNKIFFLTLAGLISANAYGQTSNTNVLKLAVDKTKHFAINTSNASIDIEGYDGDDLIVEATTNKSAAPVPPEAAGLIKIPFAMRPAEDNTISYKQLEQNSTLHQIFISTKCNYLHIKVPNNIKLFSVNSLNARYKSYLSFTDYKGAFQLDGSASTVNVSRVTGPFNIKIRGEDVFIKDVSWNANAAWPFQTSEFSAPYLITSLTNTGANIDITIPDSLKATFLIDAQRGHFFTNLPLSPAESGRSIAKTLLLNGGGTNIRVHVGDKNVFLRKL